MKEIIAIVRLSKVNTTKKALEKAGFPAFSCRKVMGRGKRAADDGFYGDSKDLSGLPLTLASEHITEAFRLIPKRVFTLILKDQDVETAVKTIIRSNSTSNPGDGKIFVLPILEAYRIRDGKEQEDSETY